MANKKQKGTTTMDDKRKLKTEMSREEMTKLLDIFNSFDSAVDSILECLDVDLSTLRDLRSKAHDMQHLLNFRSPVDEDSGHPNHWRPKVLNDAPNAWFYEPRDDE